MFKWLSDLFTRKAGGSDFGNSVRNLVSDFTHGQFGRGALMLQPGETPKDANNRLMSALGASVGEFQDEALNGNGGANTKDSFTMGIANHLIKRWAMPIVLAVVGIIILYKTLKRK